LKILHLCTYDVGGAANAALRLHASLLERKIDSFFLSKQNTKPGRNKISSIQRWNFFHRYSPNIEYHLSRILYPGVSPVLTSEFLPGCAASDIARIKPDLINLHWIDHGLLSIRQLEDLSSSKIPIVWTLHDLAPLSGGIGYREPFGLPPEPFGPLLIPDVRFKISEKILKRKIRALESANLEIVSPSRWLAEEAARSPAFTNHKISVVPNSIETELFRSTDKAASLKRFNLPYNTKIILFAADTFTETRKGIQHLKRALKLLLEKNEASANFLLLAFGNHAPLDENEWPIPVKGLGRLTESADLVAAYNAADVFACPSREDNLPNTVLESLSCGLPVVAFEVGGIPDFVIHGKTGHIAPRYNEEAFAGGIANILNADVEATQRMKETCRSIATTFLASDKQAAAYEKIYSALLRSKN